MFLNKIFAFICFSDPNWNIRKGGFMRANKYKEIELRQVGVFPSLLQFVQDQTHLQMGSG